MGAYEDDALDYDVWDSGKEQQMSDPYSDWFGEDSPYTDESFNRFLEVAEEADTIALTDADLDWPETVIVQ